MSKGFASMVLAAALAASSCSSGSTPATSTTSTVAPSTAVTTTAAPSSTTRPPTSPPSTSPSTTSTTTAPTTTSTGPTTTQPPPASAELPRVEVGPEGIEYRGGADEIETVGPSRLAVDPAGGIHFYDPVRREVWSFADGGPPSRIALESLDILNVEVFAAGAEGLVLVEIFYAPVRHRVHLVSFDGALIESIELPEGYRLEDGLSGIVADPVGSFVLEFEGGARWGRYDPTAGAFSKDETLTLDGTTIAQRGVDLEVDGVAVTADLTGFGGLRFLGVAGDGTVVVLRDDVLETTPVWQVLSTVEWYSPDGSFIGSAAVPLEEQVTDQPPGLAVTSEGRVLALIARADEVAVVELVAQPRRITEFETSI